MTNNKKEDNVKRKELKKKQRNKVDKRVAIKRIILLVLIILWAWSVFGFSSQDGDESSGLSRKVAEIFFHTEEALAIAEPIIRKIAHFTEYALGAVLMYLLADTYDYTTKNKFIIVLILGIWYASIDEIHQTFIPGRSGNIKDVCIDTAGFLFGMCLTILFLNIRNKMRLNKKQKIEKLEKISKQKKEGN